MKTCLQEKYGLFINGQWQPASDGKTFKSYWQSVHRRQMQILILL